MRRIIFLFFLLIVIFFKILTHSAIGQEEKPYEGVNYSYWLELHRFSNIENLYLGLAGNKKLSVLINTYKVKTGIPNKRPTPLPALLNRKYWLIVDKKAVLDDSETAPYFLALDIPHGFDAPFGPEPYFECYDLISSTLKQCNWEKSGEFGLHGVAGDLSRLSSDNEGSSGCIRHNDSDITFLYMLLDPKKNPIRYYVENS